MRRLFARTLLAATLALTCAGGLLAQSQAAVTPETVELTMKPGESVDIDKVVDVPELPRRLDVGLNVDNTGSYGDDIANMKLLAGRIINDVRARAPFSRFALATHVDFPFPGWGVAGEYAYRLEQQLTPDRDAWVTAVNNMRILYGNDGPESQLEALYQAALGAGREMPPTTDGDYDDRGEIRPGGQIQYRMAAAHVLAFTTDAPFHLPGDGGGPFPYPGPSVQAVIDALKSQKIRAIAIRAPGSTTQMDQIAAATGGSVVTTSSSSAEIADAIVAGLENLKFTIAPQRLPGDCDPLDVFFDPVRHTEVASGATVSFRETISISDEVTAGDLPPDATVRCEIKFKGDDTLIGTQSITVHVVLNQAPDCSAVAADVTELAPPNHRLRLVTLSGATDADGDAVTLTVTDVTQDEPIDGGGDGDSSPDAVAGDSSDTVRLRAERGGRGDGRVYRIAFEASDGRGGRCAGSVEVGVPKSQGAGGPAVDSGQTTGSFGT